MIADNLYRCGVTSDTFADIRKHGALHVCSPKEAAETFFRAHEDPDGVEQRSSRHDNVVSVVHVKTGKRMQFLVEPSDGGISATPLPL